MKHLQHKFHQCGHESCGICTGGLALCTVCGAFEGELLSTCPGFLLSHETLGACYNGNIKDFLSFRIAKLRGAKIIHGRVVWER